jgi:hypothetical protein
MHERRREAEAGRLQDNSRVYFDRETNWLIQGVEPSKITQENMGK